MNEALIGRNIQALAEAAKDQRNELATLKADGKRKDRVMAQQAQQLNGMEQRLAIVFAKMMGHGATS